MVALGRQRETGLCELKDTLCLAAAPDSSTARQEARLCSSDGVLREQSSYQLLT